MKRIAPSVLSADFAKLGSEIEAVEKAGADWIHVDVMDGHFVPNISIGLPVIQAVGNVTSLPIDVHLMISNPDEFVAAVASAGAHIISVHAEGSIHLNRTLQLITDSGARPAVALNPSTPLDVLEYVLDYVDMVLLMSVNPGFGGQSFIPNVLRKIERLKETVVQRGLDVLIQVDGGVNLDTIAELSNAGADVLVAGSAVFGSDDYSAVIAKMKSIMDSA